MGSSLGKSGCEGEAERLGAVGKHPMQGTNRRRFSLRKGYQKQKRAIPWLRNILLSLEAGILGTWQRALTSDLKHHCQFTSIIV